MHDPSASPQSNASELEAKSLVVGPEPDCLLDALRQVVMLGGFPLDPLPALEIEDRYLNLDPGGRGSSHALRKRRIREEGADERTVFTLKGPSRVSNVPPTPGEGAQSGGGTKEAGPGAVTERLEVEVPATAAGWEELRGAMEGLGITAPSDPDNLALLQARRTHRTRRAVRGPDDPTVRGELALDRTWIRIGGGGSSGVQEVLLCEVELEARGSGVEDRAFLGAVGRALSRWMMEGSALPDGLGLEPWPHSKLETGLRLEALARAGQLAGHLRPDGSPDEVVLETLRRWGATGPPR
jgi:hypothetical protein